MKKYLTIVVILLNPFFLSGQISGKVNKIEKFAKIGSVATGSIEKLAGVTIDTLCKNCKEILENNPGAADGMYTIDPDGSGPIEPFDCYCDMTTDGGGWTIVGNYKFPANYEDFMYARTDASYGTDVGNPNSTSAWTDWRILAGITWPVQFVVILDRPTFTSGWEDYNAKVIYRANDRNVMPNYGTVQDITTNPNLYYKFYFYAGYSDVGSSSRSEDFYWYPYSSGNKYLTLFHEGFDYTTYFGQGIPGGNNTWYHSAHMLIR